MKRIPKFPDSLPKRLLAHVAPNSSPDSSKNFTRQLYCVGKTVDTRKNHSDKAGRT